MSLVDEIGNEGLTLLSQGAEARVYKLDHFIDDTCAVVKERFPKSYRHPALDEKLNSQRVQGEARTLLRARSSGVHVPAVYHVDKVKLRIFMEHIPGKTVKSHLLQSPLQDQTALAMSIGKIIGLLHANDIVHGDLTTSNILIKTNLSQEQTQDHDLVLIDFGLAYVSTLIEDKAVDLYVLERAFVSTHPNSESMVSSILQKYGATYPAAQQVLGRLDKVRQRGRKKLAFG